MVPRYEASFSVDCWCHPCLLRRHWGRRLVKPPLAWRSQQSACWWALPVAPAKAVLFLTYWGWAAGRWMIGPVDELSGPTACIPSGRVLGQYPWEVMEEENKRWQVLMSVWTILSLLNLSQFWPSTPSIVCWFLAPKVRAMRMPSRCTFKSL